MNRYLGSLFFVVLFTLGCGSQSDKTGEPSPGSPKQGPVLYTIKGALSLAGKADPVGTHVFCAGTSYDAFADSEGNYAIAAVPPGRYRIVAQKPGFETTTVSEVTLLPVNPSVGPPEYKLSPVELQTDSTASAAKTGAEGKKPGALGTLSGRVVLGDGLPADLVRVALDNSSFETTTDRAGRFNLLNIEPGKYRVTFSRAGYEPASVDATVRANDITTLAQEVVLRPVASRGIMGKIIFVDEAGKPVQSNGIATVRLVEQNRTVTASQDGGFEIPGLAPGDYTLTADAKGFVLAEPVRVSVSQGDSPAVLTLRRTDAAAAAGAAVTGIVRLKGAPARTSLAGTQVALAGTSSTGVTDAQGRFNLSQLTPGTYAFVASREGYKMLQLQDVEVQGDQPTDLGTLTLERDVVAPEVTDVAPSAAERNAVVITPVVALRIRFSKPMNSDSVQNAFSLTPATLYHTRMIAGKSGGGQDILEVLLDNSDASNALQFNTRYRAAISDQAEDIEGTPLKQPYAFDFRTAGLRILSTDPPDGTTKVLAGSLDPLVIRFNGFVDKNTLDSQSVNITPRPFAMPMVWQIRRYPVTGWTEVRLPVSWQRGQAYTVTLGRAIRATDGTPLDLAPFQIRFRISPLPAIPQAQELGGGLR